MSKQGMLDGRAAGCKPVFERSREFDSLTLHYSRRLSRSVVNAENNQKNRNKRKGTHCYKVTSQADTR
jgi:hypothetical protein